MLKSPLAILTMLVAWADFCT